MRRFKYVKVAGQRTIVLAPAKVAGMLRAMQRRETWEGVIISPDTEPRPDGEGQYPVCYMSWYPGYGFQVQCLELSPMSHLLATSPALSKPVVYVEIDGQGQELWPPELFVPSAVAEQAIQYLLRRSARAPALVWVPLNDFARRRTQVRKVDRTERHGRRSAAR